MPLILRQLGDAHRKVISESYVHGLMDGEAVRMEGEGMLQAPHYNLKYN